VVAIVEADADDLGGIGDHRREADRGERMIGRGGRHQLCGFCNAAAFEQLPQGGASCHARAEIDDAIVLDRSEGGAAVGDEGEQLHGISCVRSGRGRHMGGRLDRGDEPAEFGIVAGGGVDVTIGANERGHDAVLAEPRADAFGIVAGEDVDSCL
jgi:hypothetical protein